MSKCLICTKEKEIEEMKIKIAVAESDIHNVKNDINDIRDDIKDIKTDINSTKKWVISVLVTAVATLLMMVIKGQG